MGVNGKASLCLHTNLSMALILLMFQRSFVEVQCLYHMYMENARSPERMFRIQGISMF